VVEGLQKVREGSPVQPKSAMELAQATAVKPQATQEKE
jgi:hypothetical protein